jgi:hypothetical protein
MQAATVAGALGPAFLAGGAVAPERVRIALVFLGNSTTTPEMWPNKNYDCDSSLGQVSNALQEGCRPFEFVPVRVTSPADYPKAISMTITTDDQGGTR